MDYKRTCKGVRQETKVTNHVVVLVFAFKHLSNVLEVVAVC